MNREVVWLQIVMFIAYPIAAGTPLLQNTPVACRSGAPAAIACIPTHANRTGVAFMLGTGAPATYSCCLQELRPLRDMSVPQTVANFQHGCRQPCRCTIGTAGNRLAASKGHDRS